MTIQQTAWIKWAMARGREKTTWAGILSLVAGVLGITFDVSPEQIAGFVGAIVAVIYTIAPEVAPPANGPVADPWTDAPVMRVVVDPAPAA
jgi:hypothetical protein